MIFPLASVLVSADIIIPTITKVYFEQNGQPYNDKIDFTVKGYGYSWPVGPGIEKKPGTYTPEEVFSFSSTYNSYGNKIYENYYMNYRHIDYFEVEGKTFDGKTFVIKNIDLIPTNCSDINPTNEKDERGHTIERTCEIRLNLDNAIWNNAPESASKGFWQSIFCFFKKLFGGTC